MKHFFEQLTLMFVNYLTNEINSGHNRESTNKQLANFTNKKKKHSDAFFISNYKTEVK